MVNPVTHFEVIGEDSKKLQEFYARVFSWKINADNPVSYGMISGDGGKGIGGGIAGSREPQRRGVTFYIEVASLEDTLREIEESGGRTVMPPDDVPGGPRMAQFFDPEGHRIGLVQAGSMRSGPG
ncbi:MAG: VOC family protein [Candidatus Dormibacteraceae bacterium]